MEHFTTLLLILFAGIGATTIITRSVIFDPIRQRYVNTPFFALINCMQCSGFWTGLFFGLYGVSSQYSVMHNICYCFFTGCSVSFLSLFFDLVMSKLYIDN
jgi:hypothetical protein